MRCLKKLQFNINLLVAVKPNILFIIEFKIKNQSIQNWFILLIIVFLKLNIINDIIFSCLISTI
ncbi:hypothetical protein SMM_1155 [Spiroplasma mirum ATCC 29335]|nr:hypothetical protein SMM_1155 [Spiroplasma mirum ATCC 29335]